MFKSIYKVGLMTTLLSFLMTGCVYPQLNDEVSKDYKKLEITKQKLAISADEQQYITTQRTLESTITSLATQMLRNKKMDTNKPVIITSFVRLDEFKKTSEFGRVVSESMINELSNRGFNIIEFRGQMAVSVNDNGEYFINISSINTEDLAKDFLGVDILT